MQSVANNTARFVFQHFSVPAIPTHSTITWTCVIVLSTYVVYNVCILSLFIDMGYNDNK